MANSCPFAILNQTQPPRATPLRVTVIGSWYKSHTNGSENDIRTVVIKRKISGGTVSEAGKLAPDTMLGLMKRCAKLGISYYQFLGDRLQVQGAQMVPALPSLITAAA